MRRRNGIVKTGVGRRSSVPQAHPEETSRPEYEHQYQRPATRKADFAAREPPAKTIQRPPHDGNPDNHILVATVGRLLPQTIDRAQAATAKENYKPIFQCTMHG